MNAFTAPIVINKNSQSFELERISLSAGGPDQFSENWLQDVLFANPKCLPVKEIDPHIGELIPICTEIETGAGPADILFVTPTGQVVLVETKLWRNPEARRTVVAQILDYAKQLTTWTYEDLVRESAVATKQGQDYLLSCLKKHHVEEGAFVDGVNRSLKTGDFLLLIVGDGIRSGAQSLVGFIERYGNLRFSLGLIEVAAFKLSDHDLLLQPRILAKTEVLQRTILVGSSGIVEIEDVANKEDADLEINSDRAWFQAFWSEYLNMLRLDDPQQPLPTKPARSTNIYFGMPPSAGMAWVSAYIAQSKGIAGAYLTFAQALDKLDIYYEQLLSQREDIEESFGDKLSWERNGNKIYIGASTISFTDLNAPDQRKKVQVHLVDMANRMVNVFRHRLETISKEIR